MSLFDALGAIGTGLRVAGAGMSPEFARIDAQRVENDKTRDEQKKRFLAEILTQHYQQGTINPQAYQQAMSKLGIQLPPIQAAPDYTGLGNEITQKLDSGSYLQGGGGLGGQSALKTDPTSDAAIKTLPQDNVVGQQSAPTDLEAPDVGVNAKSILPYSTAEINQATSEFADKVRSQPGTQAMKAKAIKDFRDNLIKERRSLLDEKDKLSLIKNRDSEIKAREREKDTPFLREFKAWKEYDRESDPMGYQLLTDRISRDANGNKTAIRKNIEAKMSAEGLKEGTEAWDEGLAKGMRDYFDSKKKPASTMSSPLGQDPDFWYKIYDSTGKLPPMAWGQAGNPTREAFLNGFPAWKKKQGGNAGDTISNQAEFKAGASALTALTKDLNTFEPYKNMLDVNADVAIGLGKKIYQTDSKLANRTLNWLRQNATDNPDVAEYLAQMRIVQTEAARVVANPRIVGQLTDQARSEMDSVISGDAPISVVERVLHRLKQDGANRFSAMRKQQQQLVDKLGGKPQQEAPPPPAPASQAAPMTATNPKTGERIQSDDGGKTWHPVK